MPSTVHIRMKYGIWLSVFPFSARAVKLLCVPVFSATSSRIIYSSLCLSSRIEP